MALFFVHIPKTAGTSFRTAASEYFGGENIECDYGVDMKDTTGLVREHIYGTDGIDRIAFHKAFEAAERKMFTGHFNAVRYIYLFGGQNTVTFLREPLERLISEYQHQIRFYDLDMSFEAFCQLPRQINLMHEKLRGIFWRALHFVGLTERYAEGLAYINKTKGLDIPLIKVNTAPLHEESPALSEADKQALQTRNAKDYALYSAAAAYMEAKFEAMHSGVDFCHHEVQMDDSLIQGWAFIDAHEGALPIGLFADGKQVAQTHTEDYRMHLAALGLPRAGFCGFYFGVRPNWAKAHLEVKLLTTGQSLFVRDGK